MPIEDTLYTVLTQYRKMGAHDFACKAQWRTLRPAEIRTAGVNGWQTVDQIISDGAQYDYLED